MSKLIDLTGQKFERLVVIKRVKNDKRNEARWLCQCNCGNKVIVQGGHLRNGHTKSCGCLNRESIYKASFKHGHRSQHTSTYIAWVNMKQRCYNVNDINYPNYGGRGIQVCQRWLKFENFLEDMGEKPKGLTLERIDTNSSYQSDNCRWATIKEQARNQRRNILITIDGNTQCLKDWCVYLNLNYRMVWKRIHRGWSAEEALEIIDRQR